MCHNPERRERPSCRSAAGAGSRRARGPVRPAPRPVVGPSCPRRSPPPSGLAIQPVTDNPSLAVKVPGEPFVGRREVFEYLLDHPEFATHVTRALKFARYRIWRTPTGLGIDDGWGTVGTFELSTPQRAAADASPRRVPAQDPARHPRRGRGGDRLHGPAGARGQEPDQPDRGRVRQARQPAAAVASKLAASAATSKGEKEARRLVRLFAKTTHAAETDPAGVIEKVRQRPDVPAGRAGGISRPAQRPRPPRRRAGQAGR